MVSGYPRRLGLRGFQAGFSCNPRILPLLLQDPLFLGLRMTQLVLQGRHLGGVDGKP